MNLLRIFGQSWSGEPSAVWFGVLLVVACKSVLVLGWAALVTCMMRQASAAARHLVWFLAMGCSLLLPVISLLAPAWEFRVLPDSLGRFHPASGIPVPSTARQPHLEAENQPDDDLAKAGMNRGVSNQGRKGLSNSDRSPVSELGRPGNEPRYSLESRVANGIEALPNAARTASAMPGPGRALGRWLCLLWLAGCVWVFGTLVASFLAVRRLSASASVVKENSWTDLTRKLAERLRLQRPVRLLQSREAFLPITWGVRRPVLLLPSEADEWPLERRRVVLLHELAHVKRWDSLTQTMGWIACALFWFNPLVWHTLRRMRIERERACDDLVLTGGERASDYASHLLEIARTLGALRWTSAATVAMARPSQLEGRLRAILDTKRNRRPVSRLALVLTVAGSASLVIPLTIVRPIAKAESTGLSEQRTNSGARRDKPPASLLAPALSPQEGEGRGSGTVGSGISNRAISKPEPYADANKPRAKAAVLFQRMDGYRPWELEQWRIINEFLKIGPEAVPFLIQELRRPAGPSGAGASAGARKKAIRLLGELAPAADAAIADLIQALFDDDGGLYQDISIALEYMGPRAKAAIPALIESLKFGNLSAPHTLAKIDAKSVSALEAMEEILRRTTSDNDRHITALRREVIAWIGEWGLLAAEAVPHLTKALFEETGFTPLNALESLRKIATPEAIATMHRALKHTEGAVRLRAAIALLKTGEPSPEPRRSRGDERPTAHSALPTTHSALDQRLLTSAPTLETTVQRDARQVLAECLEDRDDKIRATTAFALVEFGGEASVAAIPVLVESLKATDMYSRISAANALAKIGAAAKPAIPALTAALNDRDIPVRLAAGLALVKLSASTNAALKVHLDALNDANFDMRGRAADYLENFGDAARVAEGALKKMLEEPHTYPRFTAAKALWTLNHRPDEVVPALISILQENIHQARAVDLLGEIGPAAKAAIPVLKQSLQSLRAGTNAAAALIKIDPSFRNAGRADLRVGQDAQRAVPVKAYPIEPLTPARTGSPDPRSSRPEEALISKSEIANQKSKIEPFPLALGPSLRKLRAKSVESRLQGAEELAKLGAGAKDSIPFLLPCLRDTDAEVRSYVAAMLGDIDPDGQQVMPGLIAALKDPQREVRLNAMVSLRKIGRNAAAAIPALNELMNDDDQDLHSAAAKTLEAVEAKLKK